MCLLHVPLCVAIGCSKRAIVDPQPAEENSSGDMEYWDAVFVGGSHVGHSHLNVVELGDQNSRKRLKIQLDTKITLNRFGNETEQTMSIAGTETPEGQIESLSTEMVSGGGKVRSEISRAGDKLLVKSDTAGVVSRTELPADCLGVLGFEPDLRRNPLQAGETRSYRQFIPFMNAVAMTTLEAKSVETTSHLDEDRELLRIENVMAMPGGNTIAVTIWADDRGEVLKTDMNGLQTTYRTTKEKAIPTKIAADFDLGLESLVKLANPIENAHSTKSVRYRVRMKNGDPAEFISQTELQELTPIDKNTVDVTVRSGRPDQNGSVTSNSSSPAAEFLAPNSLIQSDAEEIAALADRVPDGDTTWQTARQPRSFCACSDHRKGFRNCVRIGDRNCSIETG